MKTDELDLLVLRNIEDLKSQKSLADEMGVSVGKVNYILKALIKKGFVKTENFFTNKNKNQYKYLLTSDGISQKLLLTKYFIKRKKEEYEALEAELDAYNLKNKGQ